MIVASVMFALMFAGAPLDCTPQPFEYALAGAPGQQLVPALANPDGFVPVTEVWKIRAAGVSTTDGLPLEWMLQIDHKVMGQENKCCWLVPLMRQAGYASGTPVLALDHEVILVSGERISARVNGLQANKTMGLMYLGWKFPAKCASALVLQR